MKKISQVLRETTVQQITGTYIRFDSDGEFEGKCALGVLACGSPDKSLHLDYDNREVGVADKLLETYGIEPMGKMIYISNPNDNDCGFTVLEDRDLSYLSKDNMMIGEIIVTLNDMWELTFDEIAEFLEVTFDL